MVVSNKRNHLTQVKLETQINMKKFVSNLNAGNSMLSLAVVAIAGMMIQARGTNESGATATNAVTEMVSVEISAPLPGNPKCVVWPNPFKNVIKFTVGSYHGATVTITLLDGLGQVVMQQTVPYSTGTMQVNVTDVPKGTYNLTLANPNGFLFYKMSISKE